MTAQPGQRILDAVELSAIEDVSQAMSQTAVPYNLRPRATKLAEGPDGSLEPAVAPVNPFTRFMAPSTWPRTDTSRGGAGAPDAPLAPPGTDSVQRTAAPFVWPRGLPEAIPNRPKAELVAPIGDLDPDIALWRSVILSIWPFTGHPTEGIWPAGWMGIDNTSQPWVCTVGGEPGTWEQVGFTSAGVASFNTRTGTVTLALADIGDLFNGGGQLIVGTAFGTGGLLGPGSIGNVLTTTGIGAIGWVAPAYPALTEAAGVLGANYTVTNTLATFLTTASLGVGTWEVTFSGTCGLGGTAPGVLVTAAVGTATATISGPLSGEIAGTSVQGSLTFTFFATVTEAGTLVFEAANSSSGSGGLIIASNQTGYTAVRIA